MANGSTFAERVTHEFINAAYRHGYTLEEISELANHPKLLGAVLRFLRREREGRHKLIIDCAQDAPVPRGWTVVEHRKEAAFAWDAVATELYVTEEQRAGLVSGTLLRRNMKTLPVFNIHVLNFLHANPHLIPGNWRDKLGGCYPCVHFWGTIYGTPSGVHVVFYLAWNGKAWDRHYSAVSADWFGHTPAAVRRPPAIAIP